MLAGKKGQHQQDRIIMTNGILPAITVGSHDNAARMNLIIVPYEMQEKSLLNRYVRYIYRKMMTKYGKERVREEALKVFAIATPERHRVKEEQATTLSTEFIRQLLDLLKGWEINTRHINEEVSVFGTPEDLDQVLLDLMPIRVRIRKLTPTECLRLMDVRDDDIERMKDSGLSNSALYKLAGNSIVCACLEGIFTQLFRTDSDSLF